ncbi:HNH endonuclease signature motif containing protein [Burkholderia ubonensis]|uniref:HNH endonuclease signature motif containing protein n=1 Tax=Burkholderia ubonensis TaxID=101571 RepID=UPI0009B4C814|nr:HNH endonuclease signature motif containing protein [Burkholderia ubonensis]
MSLTQSELKEILRYDSTSGEFFWLRNRYRAQVGQRAGYRQRDGYRRIGIMGVAYAEHRLAFLYMTGEMPIEVDHKNRQRDDNRWENLRAATRSENSQNQEHLGVTYHAKAGKWQAQIKLNGQSHYLGLFEDIADARAAYAQARKEFHPFSTVIA